LTSGAKSVSMVRESSAAKRPYHEEDEMIALLIGIVLLLFGVYAVLPLGRGFIDWSQEVLAFLKGGAPILALFIGLISLFIGIADIKDRIEAKKEEKQQAAEEESASEGGGASKA